MKNLAETNVNQIMTPMDLLQQAITKGVDVDQLEKLMQLKQTYDADNARKAYFNALSKFQSIVPALKRTKQGHNYKYTPLPDIAEQIRKPLLDSGLSYRFEMDHREDSIQVSCVVTHIDGHSERTEMSAYPDESGSKNKVQAVGSTVSYLQRYTLIGALGITTADEDIDARLSSGNTINNDEIANLEALLTETNSNKDQFLKFMKVKSLEEIPSSRYTQAVSAIERKRK